MYVKPKKATLNEMFEKVCGIKIQLDENFAQRMAQKNAIAKQGIENMPNPNPQILQAIYNGVDKMAPQYGRYFIKDVTGNNTVWGNVHDWLAIAAKTVAANPSKYAEIIKKYPQISDAIAKVQQPAAVAENTEGEEATREDALDHLSDLYKSVYGVRPNRANYASMSDEDLWVEIQTLQKRAEEEV